MGGASAAYRGIASNLNEAGSGVANGLGNLSGGAKHTIGSFGSALAWALMGPVHLAKQKAEDRRVRLSPLF